MRIKREYMLRKPVGIQGRREDESKILEEIFLHCISESFDSSGIEPKR